MLLAIEELVEAAGEDVHKLQLQFQHIQAIMMTMWLLLLPCFLIH
jgi:hypothetical protein